MCAKDFGGYKSGYKLHFVINIGFPDKTENKKSYENTTLKVI